MASSGVDSQFQFASTAEEREHARLLGIQQFNDMCERNGWLKNIPPEGAILIDCHQGSHDCLVNLQKFVLQEDGTYHGDHFHARISDRYCIPNWIAYKDDEGKPTGDGHWEIRSMVIEYYRPKVDPQAPVA